MEEIKSQYDYVIDNYVNTIVNINNMSLESSKNSKSPSRRSSVKTPIVNFNTAKSNINQLVSRNKAGNQYDRPV
jgi:hypothetical protein